MDIKGVKLRKGMTKEEVNELIGKWLTLEDEVYLGDKYKHSWRCECGDVFSRVWSDIKQRNMINCGCTKYKRQEERYKYEVEKDGEYEYIRSYRKGDILPNGRIVNNKTYIQVKHKYCGGVYEVRTDCFIDLNHRCTTCCGSYEKSFAYHIEVELGESLEKYWDFEKNTVDPYHISKNSNKKVWINCTETDYHGSYNIRADRFIVAKIKNNQGCPYCHNKKVHPKDSFAQYHIDHTDKDFLTKYWSNKNTVNPWSISPVCTTKVWIKCQEHNYHNYKGGYEIVCSSFTQGRRCSYCYSKKIHPLDSFGYKHFDKVMSWHPDNDISPFKVPLKSDFKYKFICSKCSYQWSAKLYHVSNGTWCPQCSASKGEKRISEYLRLNNIEFIYDEGFFKDLLSYRNKPLRPDFILPDHKIWIEYDGEFHYKKYYEEQNYETLKEHDRRKDEYAKEHGWKMIRIPYWEFDNIEEILKNELII